MYYLYQVLALGIISIDQIFICFNIFQQNHLSFLFWSSIVPVFIFSIVTKNKTLVMGPSIPIMVLLSQLLIYFFNSLSYIIYIPFFTTLFLTLFLFYKPIKEQLVFSSKFLTWFIVATAISILWQQLNKQILYLENPWWYAYVGILITSLILKKWIHPLLSMMIAFILLQYFQPQDIHLENLTFQFTLLQIQDIPTLLLISLVVSIFIVLDIQSLSNIDLTHKEKKWFLISHLISIIPSAPSVVKTTFNQEIKGNHLVVLGSLPLILACYLLDVRLNIFALSMMMMYVFIHLLLQKYKTLSYEPIYLIFAIFIFLKLFIPALIILVINQYYKPIVNYFKTLNVKT